MLILFIVHWKIYLLFLTPSVVPVIKKKSKLDLKSKNLSSLRIFKRMCHGVQKAEGTNKTLSDRNNTNIHVYKFLC